MGAPPCAIPGPACHDVHPCSCPCPQPFPPPTGQDRAFRAFSTIQDAQSRELSQHHTARRAKRLKIEERELKLATVVALDACDVSPVPCSLLAAAAPAGAAADGLAGSTPARSPTLAHLLRQH